MSEARAAAEPVLTEEDRAAVRKAVREFNDGHFFECHDTLEEMWTGLRGPGRDFFQGLIQVSVAFYHLGNGNLAGFESMTRRAQKRLSGYPDRYFGFDLAAHRAQIEAWRARAAAGDLAGVTVADLPKWELGV